LNDIIRKLTQQAELQVAVILVHYEYMKTESHVKITQFYVYLFEFF